MTKDDWKTLRVPPEQYEKAKAQKEEHNRTWGEQLVCSNPTTTEVVEAEEITEEIKNIVSMANEPGVEINVKRVINRIDDLENRLPRKIAEELQR
jgi:hypothetical protein